MWWSRQGEGLSSTRLLYLDFRSFIPTSSKPICSNKTAIDSRYWYIFSGFCSHFTSFYTNMTICLRRLIAKHHCSLSWVFNRSLEFTTAIWLVTGFYSRQACWLPRGAAWSHSPSSRCPGPWGQLVKNWTEIGPTQTSQLNFGINYSLSLSG